MLSSLWKGICWLNDPFLVAKFQKVCGIKVITSAANGHCQTNGMDNSTHIHSTNGNSKVFNNNSGNEANHVTNGYVKQLSNGTSLSTCNNEPKDDHLPNGCTKIRKQPFRKRWREDLLRGHRGAGVDEVQYQVMNQLFFHLFHMGASLGNEVFLFIFFPLYSWEVDSVALRRTLLIWAVAMYIGQAAKDLIRLPRPSSSQVARLEGLYGLEFGLPSTHAIVGFTLPVSLLRYGEALPVSWNVGVIVCVIWCSAVCCSRIYLGMHTVLDVLCGLLVALTVQLLLGPFVVSVDHFLLEHSMAPLMAISSGLVLCLSYPTMHRWNTARGDTMLMVGTYVGTEMGAWVTKRILVPSTHLLDTCPTLVGSLARFLLGITTMLLIYVILKVVLYRLVCLLRGLKPDERESNRKRLDMDIAVKYFLYMATASSITLAAQIMFCWTGLSRIENFTWL